MLSVYALFFSNVHGLQEAEEGERFKTRHVFFSCSQESQQYFSVMFLTLLWEWLNSPTPDWTVDPDLTTLDQGSPRLNPDQTPRGWTAPRRTAPNQRELQLM